MARPSLAGIVVIAIAAACAIDQERSSGTITGIIVDCDTAAPVSGASVTARQIGWQFQPRLMWDKTFEVTATSNEAGAFTVRVPLRKPASLIVTKPGYLDAVEARALDSHSQIRLRKGDARASGKPVGYIVYTKDCVVQ
jgi:hypothetical protein